MNPYAGQIYIDGSCLSNPGGRGGIAGLLEMPEQEPELIFQQGYVNTTNNRMEIRALIKALEYVKEKSENLKARGISNIEVQSDSEYAVKCYNSVEQWRTNKWKSATGTPIQNTDLLKKLITLKTSVRFSHRVCQVLGKSTVITKMVDKLAKAAAKRVLLKTDEGYIKAKISRTSVKGATQPFDASGEELVVRIFEHKRLSRRNDSMYKVKFEICTPSGIEKYYAYTSSEIDQLLDRWHYYKTKFNDDPRNPYMEAIEEVAEEEFR